MLLGPQHSIIPLTRMITGQTKTLSLPELAVSQGGMGQHTAFMALHGCFQLLTAATTNRREGRSLCRG